MSEADNTWRITAYGREHEIEVDHNTLTGKIVVRLDGVEVGDDRVVAREKDIDVQVGMRLATVSVTYADLGLGARSELHLDGRYVEPVRR
jgi:hypothetical protein